MTRHPYGETVIRQRAAVITDPYSQEATGEDWENPVELSIPFVAVDDTRSTELRQVDGDTTIVDYVLYADPGYDVVDTDRVVVRGDVCVVVGKPSSLTNPFNGERPGMVIGANIQGSVQEV